jgi:SAM-dependent methyltransferase
MTPLDIEWFRNCFDGNLVKEPLLDVGSAKIGGEPNLCDVAKRLGLKRTTGADLRIGDGVDVALDFGLRKDAFRESHRFTAFATVCVFNVLEHTFDPITVLSNALSCLASNGTLLVVTPAIWPLHNYPNDYNRLLPDWYRRFAEFYNLKLIHEHFSWLSPFGIEPISHLEDEFPTYASKGQSDSASRYWISRLVHRLFNTYGRSHWATHTAIAAAFTRVQ